MPNGFAYLVLALSPVLCLVAFRSLSPGRALIVSLMGAYLFLPPQPTAFDFPLVPAMTKESLPNLAVLIICLALYRDRISLLPESRIARVLLAIYVLSPIGTTLTNLDPIFFGRIGVPAMSLKDMVSTIFRQVVEIAPFLLARNLLADRTGQRDLLIAFVIAGLIYSIPMLAEVRLSPQLNIWVYGFFQHNFEQMMRDGGFRPIVFLYHGLWAAFFTMKCVVAAVLLLRTEVGRLKAMLMMSAVYLFGVLVLCKSLASLLYAVVLTPMVLLLPRRMQMLVVMGIVVVTLAYPAMKGAGLVPEKQILEYAEKVGPDRAGSLRFRLQNENVLLDRALERPVFGWGNWGRNQVIDPRTGLFQTVTDGYWVIALGMFGWVGWFGLFGLLLWPLVMTWGYVRRADRDQLSPYIAGMCLILAVNVFDMLPNATLTPLTWLWIGAILGYVERKETLLQAKPVKVQSLM
ncbi:hypothetical protein [Thalassovita sp.]|uniref:O-antigen ligase family protein n=1 Tax=Thalassovita sp. TaxID=1979401 RepID=UPI0029DE8287|nr:hypothetical protein [Thalassovita sp.]